MFISSTPPPHLPKKELPKAKGIRLNHKEVHLDGASNGCSMEAHRSCSRGPVCWRTCPILLTSTAFLYNKPFPVAIQVHHNTPWAERVRDGRCWRPVQRRIRDDPLVWEEGEHWGEERNRPLVIVTLIVEFNSRKGANTGLSLFSLHLFEQDKDFMLSHPGYSYRIDSRTTYSLE